ncbi:MAG: transposase [Nitrospira sp.]|nr:transposase [Nitrospira sp.]
MDGLGSGQRRPRTSLRAARRAGRLEEPLRFAGTCETTVFTTWRQTRLGPRRTVQHRVIMDNAAFHTSAETAELIKAPGATRLFLPPDAPDFHPIEHDFAALTQRRAYQDQAPLHEIVKAYQ